jgi:hypothetical protein
MTMPAWLKLSWPTVTAALSLAASCAPEPGDAANDLDGAGGGAAVGGPGATGTGSTGPDGVGGFVLGSPLGGGARNEPATDGGCQSTVNRAEKQSGGRADIIWVLDNSGSMTEEAAAVQAQMNTFSAFIAGTGIDVHVVVISSGPPPPPCPPLDFICELARGGSDSNGVCIAPPLGAPGACPAGDDTNFAAGYMHWLHEVGSNDALAKIQETFSGWRGMLRADATKTFVVVTDDEAEAPPTVDEFVTWVGQQPEFAAALWRYSGIYCIPGQTDNGNCAAPGGNHEALRARTGGVAANMGLGASTDWGAVFQQLADAVVADAKPVDCEWLIPPPPAGEQFDRDKINVQFTPTGGAPQKIYAAGAPDQCSDQFLGWYYDDPNAPKKVVACPQTCPTLQADVGGEAEVAVVFGCATESPPIR